MYNHILKFATALKKLTTELSFNLFTLSSEILFFHVQEPFLSLLAPYLTSLCTWLKKLMKLNCLITHTINLVGIY